MRQEETALNICKEKDGLHQIPSNKMTSGTPVDDRLTRNPLSFHGISQHTDRLEMKIQ